MVERKHQKIMYGASKIFLKKGFHPTTMREVARASRMSTGQLYHYISCKDDLLYLIHEHLQKRWNENFKKSETEQMEPVQRLKTALQNSLKFMDENRKLVQFVYSESKYLSKKHLRIVLEMDYTTVLGYWRYLLTELSRQGLVEGDLDYLASVVNFLTAFLVLRGWTVRDRPIGKKMDPLIDFILKGLGLKIAPESPPGIS